jgi:hypothetical protein
MRKQIIVTIIILIATAYITVVYFKNLNPPGSHTSQLMATIPDNASLIFEFNNEQSFYDIFNGNKLLDAVVGEEKIAEIDTLRTQVLNNPQLQRFFDGQNTFISLHPLKDKDIGLLLTMAAAKGFDTVFIEQLAKKQNTGLIINSIRIGGKQGYSIYINAIKKRFFVVVEDDDIFSGSFSEELIEQAAQYKPKNDKKNFELLSEQQNNNSLADLYVNYSQIQPLFEQLFKNKNTDILRSFKSLPALAVLSLNFKSDAFMFNGITTIENDEPLSYLNLFTGQQPMVNHLKDIFPSTTAYSTNFSVSDPLKFQKDLADWHVKAGIKKEKDSLFSKIKAETGVSLRTEFTGLLSNEFAVVTTRYMEKYAIISVKDGSKLRPFMVNISNMVSDNAGQFKFSKVPFFLLGDAFSIFKKPYFMILDNYLILANSSEELTSYYDTYINRKFIGKTDNYNQFNDLLSERSNVAFFINFKNAQPILKRDLNDNFYEALEKNEPGWKNFYAASYQFSAADKNFYTNFCLKLNNPDTSAVK